MPIAKSPTYKPLQSVLQFASMRTAISNETGNQSVLNSGAGAAGMVVAAEELPCSTTMEHAATNIYEVDPLCDPRWAALVESHPRASVFHSRNWLRALQTTYDYEPIAFTTCPAETTLTNGLVYCRIKSWLTGRRIVSLPFSDHCEPLADSSFELDRMLLQMRGCLYQHRWKYFEIRPVSYQPNSYTGFTKSLSYQFHRLDLRGSMKELFHNFHKDCVQRKIRRAEREKLRYEEGCSEDLLGKFYRLLVLTRRRQRLPPQPLDWFRSLIAAFGNDLKIRVASKDGVAVASILTLAYKKTMIYKYGCSDAAFNKLGGTALLLWRTIQEAKQGGFEELEMGRSDVDNLGLITFKERWGASGMPISYWTYPHRGARLPSIWIKRLARRVVPILPDLALETVGNLLYRHIG
jgi:hypothetical protein